MSHVFFDPSFKFSKKSWFLGKNRVRNSRVQTKVKLCREPKSFGSDQISIPVKEKSKSAQISHFKVLIIKIVRSNQKGNDESKSFG